ncbi:MAG: chorismate-binding protein [Flavisolibacter sp.]
MLDWADRFNIFCFLDNLDYSVQPQLYECLLGVGVKNDLLLKTTKDVDAFLLKNNAWLFGHLSYELKDVIQGSSKSYYDPIGFAVMNFFSPEYLLELKGNTLTIRADYPDMIYAEILKAETRRESETEIRIKGKLTREDYIQKIESLLKHIGRGDCYEINFCQDFFAENVELNPVDIFFKLTDLSPNPFSALYKTNKSYLVCASPERFLMKRGNKLFSQPMKGTIKRNPGDSVEDLKLKEELKQSAKDQSENVMVVDMVRNDLSKVCMDASVTVDELFGVYSYPNVHQMISTISGTLEEGVRFSEIINACFPMGSMTGAPKHRVMELIEEYEEGPRGIFSGSVGYINPNGDFDFNVVIRSIMYNSQSGYLSYKLGSGITFYSDPEKEWEECLLKGEAIRKVLS